MNTLELSVSGMSCEHCVNTVKNLIVDERGVKEVSIDLAKGLVTVTGDGKLNRNQLVEAINLSGVYEAK